MSFVARPHGISAFVRCKNEEEYIVASLMSVARVFDEIVVILNQSTDRSHELVRDLAARHPRVKLTAYDHECAAVGPGYLENVRANPDRSLARYYNWCIEQTTFSHVCKWDGDMIALPTIERVRELAGSNDVVAFDGYDVLGEPTTNYEPRIFRFDPERAKYVDWDLYEILAHEYTNVDRVEEKCYLHMKLVKRDWIHKPFVNPNTLATRSVPPPSAGKAAPERAGFAARLRAVIARLLRRLADEISSRR